MPRWDFVCDKCQARFELVFRTVEDSQHAKCPECSGTCTRQPAAPGHITVHGYNAKNNYGLR